ncbi:ferredoxin--NADP reductase [bacterium]|nr:ferredoxin--NADP reductase [bacterium]MBU1073843.1 ferredoxin--NADP reductase [bacterium]MBU1674391.1 ferredoxin--NADP reductase [bacterium]
MNELNATVMHRSEVTHGLLIMRVKPDFPVPDFRAGQYAVLGLPPTAPRVAVADPEDPPPDPAKLIRRAYSVASGSVQKEYLEFYVALVAGGALTPRLFALRQGDRVFLGKKIVGMFTLSDVPQGNDLVFVATGTGLAPYVSMLRSQYDFETSHRTLVIHGARHSWDLGYSRDMAALASRHENFRYVPMVSRPDGEEPPWPGLTGRVTSLFTDDAIEGLLGTPFDPERIKVFLCGNPDMITELMGWLEARGYREHTRKQPGSIFVEKYW